MKHISCVALLFLAAAGTAIGQVPGVTVALSASPANQTNVGTSVQLNASVRTPGTGLQPIGGGGTIYDRERIRFTYKMQRTWPCNEAPVPISEPVQASGGSSGIQSAVYVTHTSTYWFTQPKAGEYTLSVDVTYVSKPSISLQGSVLKPQSLGSASIAKYIVKQTANIGHNISLSANPPTNSKVTFPASVQLTSSVLFPPEPGLYKWRFVFEAAGCTPYRSGPIETSSPTATWTTSCSTPGQHVLYVYIDKIKISNCAWEGASSKYDYGYYLQAQ